MNSATQRRTIAGPAGALECAIDSPSPAAATANDEAAAPPLALVCHPHPVHGGTMDNKVAQTLGRALMQLGYTVVRFNFRGVGKSAGQWDEGRGEVDDAMAVVAAFRAPGQALVVAGFSFGAYVASQVALRLSSTAPAQRVVLVGPAVQTFEVATVPPGSLVIHGEKDDVVALSAVFDWARPQAQPVTVLPGAGHFFHGQLSVLKNILYSGWPAMSKAAT